MGYHVEVILTNGRLVTEAFGSKNYKLLNILADYGEYDIFLQDYYDLSTGEFTAKVLTKNIMDGEVNNRYTHLLLKNANEKFANSTLGAIYSYLQRDLCSHYGKTITRHTDGWPMFTQYLSDIETRSRSYYKTPSSLDFPHTFFILVRELEEYRKLYFKTIKEKFPDNIDLEADMRYVFDKAKEENLNIFFCNS